MSQLLKEQRLHGAQGQSKAQASGSGRQASRLLDQTKGGAPKLGGSSKGVGDPEGDLRDQTQDVRKSSERIIEDTEKMPRPPAAKAASNSVEAQDTSLNLSSLEGLEVGEGGKILDKMGRQIGEVTEGDPQDLVGQIVGSKGEILDEDGDIIGCVDVVPQEAGQATGGLPPTGATEEVGEVAKKGLLLQGKNLSEDGKVLDEDGHTIGQVVDNQDPSALAGKSINEKGQVLDDNNTVVGEVEIVPGEAADKALKSLQELPDISTLEGLTCNKLGQIVNTDGSPVGQLVEGDPKKLSRKGVQLDSEGQFLDNRGRVIGKAKPIPPEEEEEEGEGGPFANLGELFVTEDGHIKDETGNPVGTVVDGDITKLVGRAVDDDGDILDKKGNVLGRAEPIKASGEEAVEKGEGEEEEEKGEREEEEEEDEDEEEEEEEDLSILDGKVVNKLGNVVDEAGVVFGHIVAGNIKKLAGKKVDGQGQVWDESGGVMGMAELIPSEDGEESEGPFFGLEGLVLAQGGEVKNSAGQIVGRLVEGDTDRLIGRAIDEDGEIIDKSGNVIGRAERWTPDEPQREVSPMSGYKVNRDGEVRNGDGEVIGKLTQGNLENLVGKTVDDNGYLVDNDGQKIGECTLLEHLPAEPQLSPEELEKQQQEEEERDLAKKMSTILQTTLDSVGAHCRQITQNIEKANRTPKEELDEDKLVKDVKPLIEQAGNSLQECKGALRALDPDGQVAATAKAHSTSQEATPEEYQLANLLKELTETVVETIDNGRNLIADMPHAKKQINPLWAMLSEPLFQVIAAVGLLLSGVLGLVSNLLNELGLGGVLNSLLGGLGIDKLLEGFGLSTVTDSLGLGGKK